MSETPTDMTEPGRRVHLGRLERPVAGRWVAGVAKGLANDWDIPIWIVRLAFVLAAPIGGLGVLLYALGWLFIPREDEPDPVATAWIAQIRDRQAWVGAILVAIAAVIVLSSLNIVDSGLIWAAALLILGVLLYRGDLGSLQAVSRAAPPDLVGPDIPKAAEFEAQAGQSATPAPPQLDEEPHNEISFEQGLAEFGGHDDGPPIQPTDTHSPPRPPRPPREPSYLGRLTLGVMLVTLGMMVALDAADVTQPTSRHYSAAVILVIGAGLLVGTFYGRSRGLVVLGLLITPVALAASLINIRFDGEFGDIDAFPTSPAQLESRYRLAGGDIFLDLRRLVLDGDTVTVDADVGAGQIEVALPIGYQVEIDGEVRLGVLDVLGRSSDGFSLDRQITRPGTGGTILLQLDAGIGQIVVYDNSEFFQPFASDGPTQIVRPEALNALQPGYFLDLGTLELDLRGIPPGVSDAVAEAEVEAAVGSGDLIVLLPPWLSVDIAASTGGGVLDILGDQIAGENVFKEVSVGGETGSRLRLFLNVEQGSVVVVQP